MIDANHLLSRLDGVRQLAPDRWSARCPAHEDRSPSLSIRLTDDKLLVHCFTGCAPDDILGAIGLNWSDLYPDKWQAAEQAALATGYRHARKVMSEISQKDWASWVVALAAHDKERGIAHNLEDRATIALAVDVLKGGRAHG